jgi:hypothetical protein
MISDWRVKRNVVAVGLLENGIRRYRFRFLRSDQLFVGVLAQEVAKIVPAAVKRDGDGYLRVDYRRLGIRLLTWEEWLSIKTRKATD